jgi:putative inorganic carbon (hco3(-)) transporter
MLRTLIIVILLIGVFAMAVTTPFGALIAYQWFAYFRPQEWVWIDISVFRFSLLLGLVLVLRCLSAGVMPDVKHRFSIGIVIFLATGVIAQVNAVQPDVGWQWIDHFARLALLSLFMISLVNTPNRLLFAVMVIAVSLGTRTAKMGLVSVMSGGIHIVDGFGGSFPDNNGFALAAVMIMPMLWAISNLIPEGWQFRRTIVWGFRFATLFTAYASISTYSRGGLLALVAGFVAYIVTLRRRRFTVIAMALLIGVLAAPFVKLPDGYVERMETIRTYEEVEEGSALSRLHFWQVAWEMAKDKPLGIGMWNFEHLYDRYDFLHGHYGRGRAVHSSHFQVLAEHGFIGFFIWIGLFASALWTCQRVRKIAESELAGTRDGAILSNMAHALFASMVAFLVGGSFISMAVNEITWNTFALVAALERIASARAKEMARAIPARATLTVADGRYSGARLKSRRT